MAVFNLSIPQAEQPKPGSRNLGQLIFGKLLGFVAGLVLIAAIDAFMLDHTIWHHVGQTFAYNEPTIARALGRVTASLKH